MSVGFRGAERASMTVEQLVKMFRQKERVELSDDHLLLAWKSRRYWLERFLSSLTL